MRGGAALPAAGALSLTLGLALLAACAGGLPSSPTATGTWRTRPGDGAVMVYVPAGEFLMGSGQGDLKAAEDERPQHSVSLAAYWIDRTEVTNGQYVRFLNALGTYVAACGGKDCAETQREDRYSHIRRGGERFEVERGFADHPVAQVTWDGAAAYCEWAGARLPTEAEWEQAARGGDGRLYPWGNQAPDCTRAQYGDCGGATVPAGSLPAGASPYGALDMAGNVWEWVADWYAEEYYRDSPSSDPRGPDSARARVFRGGSWGYPPAFLRAADRGRHSPSYAGFNVGFRCAMTAGQTPGVSGDP